MKSNKQGKKEINIFRRNNTKQKIVKLSKNQVKKKKNELKIRKKKKSKVLYKTKEKNLTKLKKDKKKKRIKENKIKEKLKTLGRDLVFALLFEWKTDQLAERESALVLLVSACPTSSTRPSTCSRVYPGELGKKPL